MGGGEVLPLSTPSAAPILMPTYPGHQISKRLRNDHNRNSLSGREPGRFWGQRRRRSDNSHLTEIHTGTD